LEGEGFELRGKVEKVWPRNTGEKEEQKRLVESLQDIYIKGSNTVG